MGTTSEGHSTSSRVMIPATVPSTKLHAQVPTASGLTAFAHYSCCVSIVGLGMTQGGFSTNGTNRMKPWPSSATVYLRNDLTRWLAATPAGSRNGVAGGYFFSSGFAASLALSSDFGLAAVFSFAGSAFIASPLAGSAFFTSVVFAVFASVDFVGSAFL